MLGRHDVFTNSGCRFFTVDVTGHVEGVPGMQNRRPLTMAITMAFQPIVDIETGAIFAYEALVRGIDGQSAGEVLASVDADMIYKFD